jgi:hypothetical protein
MKVRKTIVYLALVFSVSILLMALWICLGNTELPKVLLYIGTGILYIATFAGLLRGIIWTVEHFVKWIEKEDDQDAA